MNKKYVKRYVAFLLTIVMMITTCYSPHAIANESNRNVYSTDNYAVIFEVVDSWSGAYNANVTIKNIGQTSIEDWSVIFPLKNKINNIWNATIDDYKEGCYSIKNANWNQDIKPGTSISFGFTADGDFSEFPSYYVIPGKVAEISTENYDIMYEIESDWRTGFNGLVTITNKKDVPIKDWILEFNFNNEIDDIWNAKIGSHEGNHYLINNADYNQNIGSQQSISFGFTVKNGVSSYIPEDFICYEYVSEINQVELGINTEQLTYDNDLAAYKVSENILPLMGTLTFPDQVKTFTYQVVNEDGTVESEDIDIADNWIISQIPLANGYNDIIVSAMDRLGNEVSQKITVYVEGGLLYDDDYMKVENAYSQLHIDYQNNDTQDSVTKNIILANSIDGVDVIWTSSGSAIISNEGIVTRPENRSEHISLTATISCGDYTRQRQFTLYVIKNTYVDYNTDYIQDADNFEFLYLFNEGDLENLEVYINDDGYLQFISGSFSDIKVESPEEAILSLYSIKTLMGGLVPKLELNWVSTSKDEYGSSFRFEQTYNGVPLYGQSVVVSTDSDGKTTSLQSSYIKDININTTPVITEQEAINKVHNAGLEDVHVDKLYIFMKDSLPQLAWNVFAKDADQIQYNYLIDAITGEEIYQNTLEVSEMQIGETTGNGTDELGNNKNFPLVYFSLGGTTNYSMRDIDRNIIVYDMQNNTDTSLRPGTLMSHTTNTWAADEVSAYTNVIKCYDYFKNNFGRDGFDNANSPLKVIIRDGSNIGNSYNLGDVLNFGSGGGYIYSGAAALDTVGHEYTHGVVRCVTSLGLYNQNAPGAINEGYADIFGYFIEGDNDVEWLHREDNTKNARALRNMSNPAEFGQPSKIGDPDYYDFTTGTYDLGGIHINNTIVSHACYLMWNNGISDKSRLSDLWYHSLLLGYDSSSTFNSVRLNVLTAAKNMRMTASEIQIIKDAFDAVGITGMSPVTINGTNTLTGKVVIADLDTALSNNTPLPNTNVSLVRSGSVLTGSSIADSYKFTKTENDGTFYFIDLVPGEYKLTISKDGYYTTTQMVTLSNTRLDNYCNTVELIPKTYTGTGTATGTIKDSVTGNGVADLSLSIRVGMNSKTGTIINTLKTKEDGSYATSLLSTGHYCIEVKDSRTLGSGEKRYYTTYFNIKVLGGHIIANQNATVSTSLNSDQLRIVLQWGATPRDLDSHLLGPTSNGGLFHIYYSNKSYSENTSLIADLDLDDTSSYGPETTTIYNPIDGVYTYYIYNYSGSPSMSTSGATVQVYTGNNNEPSYVFSIPVQSSGLFWTVFTYDTTTRRISPVNVVGNAVVTP